MGSQKPGIGAIFRQHRASVSQSVGQFLGRTGSRATNTSLDDCFRARQAQTEHAGSSFLHSFRLEEDCRLLRSSTDERQAAVSYTFGTSDDVSLSLRQKLLNRNAAFGAAVVIVTPAFPPPPPPPTLSKPSPARSIETRPSLLPAE